ncbi:Uncharacterised protein [Salmonella enterica subsp. enterica serovar Bovismorbificans]|nr:Uncharacterised protein [Salmonella enterica subsp. enterica serovar Bovismorbificans]
MRLEVVRYTADGIYRIPQVNVPIAIEIDRIFFIGRWHKLAVAHRAGKGTFQIERIVLLIARHEQEGFQLAGEIFRPARIVK